MAEPTSPANACDPAARSRRRRLGEMLVDAGIVSPDQLEEALRRQKAEKGTRLGRLLVDLGFATETQICEIVADQLRIPAADMVAVDVAEDVLAKVTRDLALKHTCLPCRLRDQAAPACAVARPHPARPVPRPPAPRGWVIARATGAEPLTLALSLG